MTLFTVLGILLGIYTIHAAMTGEVFAKSGPWGRTIRQTDSPKYFWVVITIYAGLSIALVTVF